MLSAVACDSRLDDLIVFTSIFKFDPFEGIDPFDPSAIVICALVVLTITHICSDKKVFE